MYFEFLMECEQAGFNGTDARPQYLLGRYVPVLTIIKSDHCESEKIHLEGRCVPNMTFIEDLVLAGFITYVGC